MSDLESIQDDVPEIEFEEIPAGAEPPSGESGSGSDTGSPSSPSEPPAEGGSSSAPQGLDPLSEISKGFKELGEVLKEKQTVNPTTIQQQPNESDEEFAERLKEQLFSENPLPALKEAVQRFTQPAVAQATYATMELAKKVIKLDPEKGPIYQKYESEINDFIKTLPPNVQQNPGIYEYAYKEIYSRHIDDIVEERLKQKEQELLEKLQKEKQSSASKHGPYMVGDTSVKKVPKRKVYYTSEDKAAAERMGLDIKDYLMIKGRL